MSRRTIREESTITLGGTIVAKYHAYADEVELIVIVRTQERFFAVVTRGRQAHRAFARPLGTPVSITGTILEYLLPDECGYRVVYVVGCQRISFSDTLEQLPPDLLDGFAEQLPKHQIFRKCESLNGISNSSPVRSGGGG